MKTTNEIIEKYIDYYGEREFVEKLTISEQLLYRLQLRNTISFSFFLIHERFMRVVNLLIGSKEE